MQRFYIRAEHPDNPLVAEEIIFDLPDFMRLIEILIKQQRDMRLGKKLIYLLKCSNPKAIDILKEHGIKIKKENENYTEI